MPVQRQARDAALQVARGGARGRPARALCAFLPAPREGAGAAGRRRQVLNPFLIAFLGNDGHAIGTMMQAPCWSVAVNPLDPKPQPLCCMLLSDMAP